MTSPVRETPFVTSTLRYASGFIVPSHFCTATITCPFTGGITSTAGRLILTGTARDLTGVVPRLRVTGTYTLTGNVTTIAPLQVQSGRLRNTAFRIRVSQQ